jgi:cell wall-associated NlpC family hydrolase
MEGLSDQQLSSHPQTKQSKALWVKRSILHTTRLLLPTIVFIFAVLTTTEARKSHTEKKYNYTKKYKTERKLNNAHSSKTKHYTDKRDDKKDDSKTKNDDTSNKFQLYNNATAEISDFRRSVIAYAESFLGIRYVLGGTGNGSFDCSGYVRYVLNNFSVDLTTTAHQQCQMGERIPLSFVRPGDLVFFGTKDWISHVGMVYSYDETGLTIIHCATSKGVAKENISKSNYWLRKIQYATNIIGM